MQITSLRVAAFLALLPAVAAAAPEKLGAFQDWTALREGSGKQAQCYALAKPKDAAKLKRAAYATVTVRKGAGEVNVVSGAPWKPNADIRLTATGTDFNLFTKGDGAWAYDADSDKAIVAAFRKGKTFVVNGITAKGEKLSDTYSLAGFPAAFDKALAGCK